MILIIRRAAGDDDDYIIIIIIIVYRTDTRSAQHTKGYAHVIRQSMAKYFQRSIELTYRENANTINDFNLLNRAICFLMLKYDYIYFYFLILYVLKHDFL